MNRTKEMHTEDLTRKAAQRKVYTRLCTKTYKQRETILDVAMIMMIPVNTIEL